MVHATANGTSRKRLTVGMVGGGRSPSSRCAPAGHAARRPDRPRGGRAVFRSGERSRLGAEIGIAPERSYADYRAMAKAEAARPDGIEAVVVVTPNHLHAPIATAFLEAGIDVICDKPLSTTLAEAEALVTLTKRRSAASSSRSTTPATPWCARRARWWRRARSAASFPCMAPICRTG
ncbi:Gfo/Idh/MocA family oxidoreductase [Mesorhizobium sp. M1B.F.Ca.ET.045.04.1.1]|uniref:Gfo/Idh/MocA family protein n=1 Tax=Mesorhizobium sp. M1B.F.Ca.ET.045.04.1.1 TaxID=2493673 RepID=UPI001678F14A|nr:Gfo/Idh/MocA family oxidoreductase [Mesorhizobium sp. M1B.F.Ca.ET.045.04.1.1]